MADHKITDFVDQSAIDGLQNLKREMKEVKDTYVEVANELLKTLKIKVEGLPDLEKMATEIARLQREAAEATQKHSTALESHRQVVANTTNTISRQLMEQERLNEKTRDAYTRQQEVKEILKQAVSSYDDMTKRLIDVKTNIERLNQQKREEKKAYEDGKITYEQYRDSLVQITKQTQLLQAEKSQLESYTKSEAKENINASSSYNAMSQELARLKKAYRELDEEGRNSDLGQSMKTEIQELSAHLKDMDAGLGDFQRNVGDYAIASQNGVVVTEDLNRVLEINATTVAGCIEQNKELEKAKNMLDQGDVAYAETLEKINKKIDENKQRIADVDSIMQKQATTVAEAQEQNRILAEALKLVDLNSAGAKERIEALNKKIADNNRLVRENTPALQDQAKANEGLADKLLSTVGLNTRFTSSLQELGKASAAGNVVQGLTAKVGAFGKALLGLLANPWVLAILGIGGVVAGVKWIWDYNKGIAEATKLTKDFTGKTGDDMKKFRSEVAGVADQFGKDFKDVLNATDKMANQLGITFEESLDAIKDGFLANADAQGNFLANVEKFSPALRDAGLNAREMVAVISQTRSGLFSEDGLKAIQVASDRLKRMPKNTAEALDAIGMSHKQIQKDLTEGTKSMMEVIQEASAKIAELPENSKEVGDAVFNLFGRKAAAGGVLMVESLRDVNTNLDEEKAKMAELAEIQEEQLNSQIKLEETLSAVFDTTGGWFEKVTAKAKIFINEGLVRIIEETVNIINYWIRLYNTSKAVRAGVQAIVGTFKNVYAVGKAVLGQIIDAFKALGEVVDGVLTLDVSKIKSGYEKGLAALRSNVENLVKDVVKTYKDGMDAINSDPNIQEVSLNLNSDGGGQKGAGHGAGAGGTYSDKGDSKGSSKAAEKAAEEEINRINELEEAKIKAMQDGHAKEMAQIRFNYEKKIREIRGNSEKEKRARIELTTAMNKDLAECEKKYQDNLSKINLSNRLETVKKGSKEELDLKLAQLKQNEEAEKKEAEKTGADVFLIRDKYEKKRHDMLEEYANARMSKIQEDYAAESVIADNAYNRQVEALRKRYAEELKAAGKDQVKREEATRNHEERVARLTETYAKQKAQSSIDAIEQTLKVENLSAEDRAKLEAELAAAKIELEKSVTDAVIAESERQVEADKRAADKRMENAKRWLGVASEALNAINDLASAVFDNKISQIEKEDEANTESASKEQERISDLVEKKVITEEEGEARKRAAEAKSAKQHEELEKKKKEMAYKQAIWEKANSVAQIGISTALAIMNALSTKPVVPVGVALAALAGTMGAIQLATALATPIPKYAKGTTDHPGGLAIVGDGGRREVVSFGGDMYLTPDKPTLVDMPKGAEVYPDAAKFAMAGLESSPLAMVTDKPQVIVNNDYKTLERKIDDFMHIVKVQTREQKRAANRAEFEMFKLSKGL